MVGDAFMQGPRYRLPLPKVCRPFGAYIVLPIYPRRCLGLIYYAPTALYSAVIFRPFGAIK